VGSNFTFANYDKLDKDQIKMLEAMIAKINLGRTIPDIASGLKMKAPALSKILVKMYPLLGVDSLQQLITLGYCIQMEYAILPRKRQRKQ